MPPILTEQALFETLSEFLALVENPEAGEGLFGLYAPGAMLFYEGGLHRRDALSLIDFERAFRDASGAGPKPLLSLDGLVYHELRNDRALAWFQARDGDECFFLAAGFLDAGGWKIDWLTLAEAREDWDDALGRAQTLADFPYALGIKPRSWLDVAHYRLYGHEKPQLHFMEGARFSCQGSAVCCKIDHAIEIDEPLQAVVDAIPWEFHRPELKGLQLPLLPNGLREVKKHHEACRFLDELQRCSLHKALGRALFPPCARFPFTFAETPEGMAVGASAACGSVRANLGEPLPAIKTDLYRRLAIAKDAIVKPRVFRLKPDTELPWERFLALETSLQGHLNRSDLPLDRRLWLGSVLLGNQPEGPAELPSGLELTPWNALQASEREMIHLFLLDFLQGFAPGPWALAAADETFAPDTLVALMRGLLHAKVYSFVFNLATAHNLCILMYLLALHLEMRLGSPWPDGPWIQLGKIFHQGGLLNALLEPGDKARDQRAMLGDPAFGLWLLSTLKR